MSGFADVMTNGELFSAIMVAAFWILAVFARKSNAEKLENIFLALSLASTLLFFILLFGG